MVRQLGDAVLTYQAEKVGLRGRALTWIRFVIIFVIAILMALPLVIMHLPSPSKNKEKVYA